MNRRKGSTVGPGSNRNRKSEREAITSHITKALIAIGGIRRLSDGRWIGVEDGRTGLKRSNRNRGSEDRTCDCDRRLGRD